MTSPLTEPRGPGIFSGTEGEQELIEVACFSPVDSVVLSRVGLHQVDLMGKRGKTIIHPDQGDAHDGLHKISLDPKEQFAQHGVLEMDWQLPHLMGFEAERKGNGDPFLFLRSSC